MLCESVLATFGNIIRQRIGVCMECCWCVRSCTLNIYIVVEVDDEKRNETDWMDIVVFKYVCVFVSGMLLHGKITIFTHWEG